MKVCLVGSSGGHLTHLYMLKPFWKDKDHFWVTFDKEDARSRLEGEKMYPCYYPTNRSLKALIKNTKIAWNVLHKEKPDLIKVLKIRSLTRARGAEPWQYVTELRYRHITTQLLRLSSTSCSVQRSAPSSEDWPYPYVTHSMQSWYS